jgi:hypothetical protein
MGAGLFCFGVNGGKADPSLCSGGQFAWKNQRRSRLSLGDEVEQVEELGEADGG